MAPPPLPPSLLGEVVFWISSYRDDQRIFGGLKDIGVVLRNNKRNSFVPDDDKDALW